MATLRDIRRRITSVKSTQQITRAMKLVSAAKLRRAQERLLEARPFAHAMGAMIADLAEPSLRERHPLLAERSGHRRLLLVVSGDRGLCGGFNSNIIRRSLELLRDTPREADARLTLLVVGRKARDFYRRRGGVEIRAEHAGIFDKLAYSHAAQIAREVTSAYLGDEVDQVDLLYNEFKSAAAQRVAVEPLLPIRLPTPAEETATVDFEFEPSPEAVLASLLPRHVEVAVFHALMESLAAEHGARMTAMDNATRNAAEMIDLLTLQFNKARQERITKELLEIVGGAEALRQAGG
jgi:F-type H+-transporting ATPase subunit gamma